MWRHTTIICTIFFATRGDICQTCWRLSPPSIESAPVALKLLVLRLPLWLGTFHEKKYWPVLVNSTRNIRFSFNVNDDEYFTPPEYAGKPFVKWWKSVDKFRFSSQNDWMNELHAEIRERWIPPVRWRNGEIRARRNGVCSPFVDEHKLTYGAINFLAIVIKEIQFPCGISCE